VRKGARLRAVRTILGTTPLVGTARKSAPLPTLQAGWFAPRDSDHLPR
jgi:hypothetical protein